jgi:hypothetical protein
MGYLARDDDIVSLACEIGERSSRQSGFCQGDSVGDGVVEGQPALGNGLRAALVSNGSGKRRGEWIPAGRVLSTQRAVSVERRSACAADDECRDC